jgi:hypothetical protein
MKRIQLIFLFLLGTGNLFACDICGCSGGLSAGGLFPQVQNNLLGLRNSWQHFDHPRGNFNGNSEVLKDHIYETDLFLRWFPRKRLQVWANAPFRVVNRIETERITSLTGIGDIQARAFYTVIKPDSNYHKFRHFLLAGGGVSLPTGKYRQRDENLALLPLGLQIGTGAWALMGNAVYLVQTHRVGLQIQGDYRMNFENEDTFKKGNNLGAQTGIFLRSKLFRNVLFLPQLSYRAEKSMSDMEFGLVRPVSGIETQSLQLSAECFGKGWMASVVVRKPIWQNSPSEIPVSGMMLQFTAGITW